MGLWGLGEPPTGLRAQVQHQLCTLTRAGESETCGQVKGKFEIVNMDMVGTGLKIKGKMADDADGLVGNLGQGTDKRDLHFNPRFGESTIVCNSPDCKGQEQRADHTGLSPGPEVKFTVAFEDKSKVKLPDGHQLTFPSRLGHSHQSSPSVPGGFHISSELG
ncbi:LOW QUALITY PROTEIN: galectin-2 [Molossus nigricans]